jgi:hypothetical protein
MAMKIVIILEKFVLFCFGGNSSLWARVFSFLRFLDHTQRTTVGSASLDELSARRKEKYHFSVHKKRLPEEDVNTWKHVGVLYEMDIAVNVLCVCWSKL